MFTPRHLLRRHFSLCVKLYRVEDVSPDSDESISIRPKLYIIHKEILDIKIIPVNTKETLEE